MCLPAMIQAEFRKYIINDIKSRQNLGSRQGWKISDDVQIQLSFAQANVDQKYFKVYSQLKQLLPSLFYRYDHRSCVVRYYLVFSLVISHKIILFCPIISQEFKKQNLSKSQDVSGYFEKYWLEIGALLNWSRSHVIQTALQHKPHLLFSYIF